MNTRGIGTPAIVALVAALIVIGGIAYYNMRPEAELMMVKGEDMKKDGEAMMEKGDAMMEKGDAMMEKGVEMQKVGEVMMKKEDGAMMEKAPEAAMAKTGTYESYTAEKIARAETGDVVLFFRASWCPTCRGLDADIKKNASSIPGGVTILDVDYDNSSALKQRYGVTYQHTMVQVDASGNLVKKWTSSPTLAALVAEIK